jgi:hypothetical protein
VSNCVDEVPSSEPPMDLNWLPAKIVEQAKILAAIMDKRFIYNSF